MGEPLLYYVRHGQTAWNAEGRLQGHLDSELTAAGRAHADRSAEVLRDLIERDGRKLGDFDFVASPLGRAQTTMQRVRAVLGLDPERYRLDARLAEVSYGRWDGFTFPELQLREEKGLAARERDKWGFVPPDGESYADLLVRVGAWHETVVRDSVVVAHGGTARALMVHLRISVPEKAPAEVVDQGVVYLFAPGRIARYG
jgi:broad specificity phosphatase PhoE